VFRVQASSDCGPGTAPWWVLLALILVIGFAAFLLLRKEPPLELALAADPGRAGVLARSTPEIHLRRHA
jgi:hypothetical protein